MRAAIALTDAALAQALPQIRLGMTELELSWIIESYMRIHGAESVAFELIVSGGAEQRPAARSRQQPPASGRRADRH